MIPQGGSLTETIAAASQPSATWRMDLERGVISGKTDGLHAIKQAVFKILQSQRFRHVIYSGNYGNELAELVGRQPSFVQLEAQRMLEEALLQDDRIIAVEGVKVSQRGDQAVVTFTVHSDYGSFEEEVVGFA
ncbi:hypothetical protein A7K91_01865 [Paenibacillus oryzae]|uniref:Phage portal protein n=1 Tax=Paenibacillus oryzae TaxID=1844972 RepID=A0A1A5Y9U3_9BACL|nr:DUF2634 domain-containing protein [Paenibacillus oryzae]OBR62389.1 hypothetical protein A7K91_01865 [Paenibacillus oryzae]